MFRKNVRAQDAEAYNQYRQQATAIKPTTRRQWEKMEQKRAVAWFHWVYRERKNYYKLFYHIPNEGKRDPAYGKMLKDMGMKKGMLDLHLDVPSTAADGQFYYGLRIEVKPRDEDCQSWVSDEQKDTIRCMNEQGYFAKVCYGFKEIKETIEWYLASS